MQKSVEIIEFEHAKTGSRWSYVGDAADRVRRDWVRGISTTQGCYGTIASADRSTKDAHIIAARDLSGLFGREAAAQHRRDEMHPLRVVLQTAGGDPLPENQKARCGTRAGAWSRL